MAPSDELTRLTTAIAARRAAHREFLLAHRLVDVDRTIAPDDSMFTGDLEHYLLAGLSALHWIDAALSAAERPRASVTRILDLPCGHGRVLRALRAVWPDASIVACDIERPGVDFCAATFGAEPVYSAPDLAAVDLPGDRDLIWVGSLFTHLPADAWPSFLDGLAAQLAPGGVLVFTAAGDLVADLIRAGERGGVDDAAAAELLGRVDRDGFGYATYGGGHRAERQDQEYGRAVARPAWVLERLQALSACRLVLFAERAWDCRQDVYALVREA